MGEESSEGIVYILTNPAMPGLVKIGKTSRDSMEKRLVELYSTGVPVPFECEYAARVEDAGAVEQALHAAFEPNRINPKREFFELDPEQTIAVLKLISIEDVTPEIKKEAGSVDVESQTGAQRLKSRRPNLDFHEMGIPPGTELKFALDDESVVEVVDNRRVKYHGEDSSLTAITRQLEKNLGAGRRNPTRRWTHNGRSLKEIYEETYGPL